MTLFWIVAVVMVLMALAMVVPVLWRERAPLVEMDRNNQNVAIARERLAELEREREDGNIDEAEFETVKQELERILLDDLQAEPTEQGSNALHPFGRRAALVLAVLFPVATAGLYMQLGTPQLIDMQEAVASEGSPDSPHSDGELPSVDDMVSRLAERLENEPDNAEGWFTLGRTYLSMQRYPEAAQALEKVHALVGDHPTVMLSLADALAMSNGGQMSGRPAELVYKALEADPENVTGLWLAGVASRDEGEFARAIAYWRKLEPLLIDEPESLLEVRQLIANTEKQMNATAEADETKAGSASAAVNTSSLQVEVYLEEMFSGEVKSGDTLFVYAKAESGPPMPLAVVRKAAADLPLKVTLDDSMAMTPQMKLSSFSKVKIGARISRSGNAIAQSGDLVGEISGVSVSRSEPVVVRIGQRVP